MSGDGLVRPLNAPPAGQLPIGVQPGVQSAIILANQVIVFGAGGGVFVYNGTPALGNPPIAWMASGTKDPYGNPLPNSATMGIASSGTFAAGNQLITPAGIFTYPGTPGPGGLAQSVVPGAVPVTDPFGNAALPGFTTYQFSGGTWYALNILSSQMVIWTAPASTGPYTQSAAGLFFLTGANTFINALAGQKIELSAPVIADFTLETAGAFTADTTADVLGAFKAHTTAEIVSTLTADESAVFASVSPPAQIAGKPRAFGSALGALHVIDGTDGNNYTTERLTQILNANSSTLVALTTIFLQAAGVRTYRIQCNVLVDVAIANAQVSCAVIDTAGTATGRVDITVVRAATFFGCTAGNVNATNSVLINLPAANGYIVKLNATVTVLTAGNISVQFGSATAQGIVLEQYSTMEYMPS